jgi:lipopolysaccharide transport system ATP-binding protein
MSSEVAIRVDGVSKRYELSAEPRGRAKRFLLAKRDQRDSQLWALRDISFRVYKGETLGIIGRNGAGKTTLLRVISKITEPTSGSVSVYGSIAPVLALQSGFNAEFTGRENIYLKCAVMGLSRKETDDRIEEILDFASIGEFIDRPLKAYSQGMRARLAFAVAINVEPEILVIDEVLAVGDEAFRRKCIARIVSLKEKGATILFVSHGPALVLQFCDRAILLDNGELLIAGDPKLVVSSYQRFIHAPLEERSKVRANLRALATSTEDSEKALSTTVGKSGNANGPARPQSTFFDPGLAPESTTQSMPQGARIIETKIVGREGTQVNQLAPRQRYEIIVTAVFPQPTARVWFCIMIKTVEGLKIAGAFSRKGGSKRDLIDQGAKISMSFPFGANLASGTYLVDVGVLGEIDGLEVDLHRILDAAAFRVLPDPNRRITGIADLFSEPECVDISKRD